MDESYQKKVITISIIIMFYQAMANADLAVISQFAIQKGNTWAGPLLTSFLFMGSGLGSLYNQYVGKYKVRYCFFFGSFGYSLFIAIGILFMSQGFSTAIYIIMFVVAGIGGLIASVFYNSTYNYVNILGQLDAQSIKYFGIYVGIVQFCNLLGMIISALLIQKLGQLNYLITLEIIIFMISLTFLCFNDPSPISNSELQLNQQKNNQQTQNEETSEPFNPFKLCFVFGMTGIIISFIYTQLSIIIYKTFEGKMTGVQINQLTFVLFVFEGLGQIVGGIFVVFYSQRENSPSKPFILLSILFMVSVLIIYVGHMLSNTYIIGFGAFIAGITDCATIALVLSIAGKWGKQGVTAFNLSQTIAICISGLLLSVLETEHFIGWICINFLLSCLSVSKYYNSSMIN